ncbi:MAG TPA: fumarate hydratase [Atribacter sp.]|jgi:fumarate hydratase subunit alpha|uniref:L(+)-tartrate dehydratase subunit alpha n=1 Tax=Candidatus Atribacter allofermentans TaxID=1852833 RepID=A0A1V5SIL4_9BACT|nr:fumarate hydratase [Atribacter sp.]MDD3713384.1 fumarate hydratase [Atribacterota bacterium]OQA54295.1 MAG: L(+)-tartrate dehydratase subunit alpha [Candidatus Atribacteria bacterium ADurb.Bin276]HQK82432.1 fumarate hydratase [Atribacter sp.]
MMKFISLEDLISRLESSLVEMNTKCSEKLQNCMIEALTKEKSDAAREMLSEILENYVIAQEECLPLCQDTGMVMAEVSMGIEVALTGGTFQEALDEAIRRAYQKSYFRKSVLTDPLIGKNTGDNTPGIVFIQQTHGDELQVNLLVKGGGCDNISALKMMTPGIAPDEIKKFILQELDKNASRACPPLIVGVGIGGNAAYALYLASRALGRPLGTPNHCKEYRQWEEQWKNEINQLGIGPQGVGGKVTCLEVRIESYPTHIASLPVGMVCSCHVFRQKKLSW